ncbi:MAG TPA: thymidine phosphorylase [Gemmatimonadaceae bacterium]|nr:thymidine phosphorylase [Gemmatimonadaceae bacterium]
MLAYRLIERKRDGARIESGEWRAFINAYAAGHVPEYQMAAFLMAVCQQGLDPDETRALTRAMLRSGAPLDLTHLAVPHVGIHSTGGVGDKISLVLSPIVASLNVAVPMIADGALAHTGSMVDKLEAIPGMRTDLTLAEARAQLERLRCVFLGPTSAAAPVDGRMAALRYATATAESVPLIAASIMSRTLAEGVTGLVLDVKRGSGALLRDLDSAIALARTMAMLGVDSSCPVAALITAMDRPLGRAVGNALETEEAILALKGEGPPDLMEVTYALGGEMLQLAGVEASPPAARRRMEEVIASGRAAETFQQLIEAQGGNPGVVDDPAVLPQALACELYEAPRRGFIAQIDARVIGRGLIALGGGRMRMAAPIDPTVGFVITPTPGDWVDAREPLATIFARDAAGIEIGRAVLHEAIRIADEAEPPLPLISHRISAGGVEAYAG